MKVLQRGVKVTSARLFERGMQTVRKKGETSVVFGKGVFSKLPHLFEPMRRPLLVTDARLAPSICQFRNMFPDAIVYDQVVKEPDMQTVRSIQTLLRKDVDCVVALGGGSPMDAAKAATRCDEDGTVADTRTCPLIAVPTTAGTGSEVTPFAVVQMENGEKKLIQGDALAPTLAVVDYSLTLDKPPLLTACTGVDALCHALEAFVSLKSNQESDAFALRALVRIGAHLKKCVQDPCPHSREQMMRASTEAGFAFSKSSVTLVHGMSRPLGRFGIGHGMGNAQLLADVVEFSMRAKSPPVVEKYRTLQSILFPDSDVDESFPKLLRAFVHDELGIPTLSSSLQNENEYMECVPQMIKEALESGSPQNNPILPSKLDLRNLYHAALK